MSVVADKELSSAAFFKFNLIDAKVYKDRER